MNPKATTFRLEPTLQEGLERLSKMLKRPMNQLVNEALKDYVNRRSLAVEQDLEATLATLRAHLRRDPSFKESTAAVAKAEAEHAKNNPVGGEIVIGDIVDGEPVEETAPSLKPTYDGSPIVDMSVPSSASRQEALVANWLSFKGPCSRSLSDSIS
jgi:predicted transcriptional regulator